MPNVATRFTALLLGISVTVGAQSAPSRDDAECLPRTDRVTASGFAGAAMAVTAAQKVGANRSEAWTVAPGANAAELWNDSQTPAHLFASYQLTRVGMHAFGACRTRGAAVLRGVAYSTAIGVAKEVVDGYYTGFNAGDLAVNGVGIGLAVAQAYVPQLESASLTVSLAGLHAVQTPRGRRLGGEGHAMWLSLSPRALLPGAVARRWPAPVRMSLGRRTPASITGAPEYAVTLDLDASALLPRSRRNSGIANALRAIHLPSPGVIMASGRQPRYALVW